MKNLSTIILALACALLAWLAYVNFSKVQHLEASIKACEKAAQESSAETYILQQQADKHREEAEKHKEEAEKHRKIVEELKNKQ